MGKKGPCCHCGVTSTPLWRNGPAEKPVLCNACGSRWRTKGSLTNYTPLHARVDPSELLQDNRVAKVTTPIKNKEPNVIKRKINLATNRALHKVIYEDTSNRSSSGSAMSNSDTCVQIDSADTSELTGCPSQSILWDSSVPSPKRTCVIRPKTSPSSLEDLTRDLYTILHEQQSSCYSGSCEDDLLFESDAPMVSVEIGHGSVLIQHPSYIMKEEESVASSFPVDNKPQNANQVYSCLNALFANNYYDANGLSPGIEKISKSNGMGMPHEQLKRETTQREILHILGNPYSSLRCVDLKEVLNIEEFERHLTTEEQQQLLKYLPFTDTAKPDSLIRMFGSAQFKDDISSFQKLLADGVFDLSFSGVKAEDCKMLRKLALGNLTKSKWVEQYNLLKEIKSKHYNEGSVVQKGPKPVASGYSTNLKKPRDSQFQKHPDAKLAMKRPTATMKDIYEHNEFIDKGGSCFAPKSLFMSPPANNSRMSNSFIYMDESSDQNLLLDVPSNGSFPEAELFCPTPYFGTQASTSSSSIHPKFFRPS